jgi:hypothetical protein
MLAFGELLIMVPLPPRILNREARECKIRENRTGDGAIESAEETFDSLDVGTAFFVAIDLRALARIEFQFYRSHRVCSSRFLIIPGTTEKRWYFRRFARERPPPMGNYMRGECRPGVEWV